MKFLLFVIIIFIPFFLSGQAKQSYEIRQELHEPIIFEDSVDAVSYLNELTIKLQDKGFLLADYILSGNTFKVNKGPQFQWAKLKEGNLPAEYLGTFAFENKFSTGKPLSVRQISRLYKAVLLKAENSGYPFAKIYLDSVFIDGSLINAVIEFKQGPLITFDSVKIKGYAGVNRNWLSAYLNIRQGTPFSEKSFRLINDKIFRLPFLDLATTPEITFQNDEATVVLHTQYIKANKFDAIIGFMPKAGKNAGLLITGQANVELYNLFQRGHNFALGWRSIRPETQELISHYNIPHIINSPISITASIDFYKQDSSFFNQNWKAGLAFQKNRWELGAYSKFFRSSIQRDIETGISDIKVDYAGFNIGYSSKGKTEISANALIGAGNRTMESADKTTEDIQAELQFNSSLKLYSKQSFILLAPATHFLINENLLMNDLLRIGGLNSVRGFPENFFFVKNYSLLRSEYHWVFGGESSFFALLDAVYMDHKNADYAYGVGLGFDLKVNNGIFELIYALGGYENVSPSFDRSVIHFGYKAIF